MSDAGDRQRRAADPASSVWVGASAGTGKTKVLVDRVLRLMLADAPPEKILCLTFTKAAAAEMLNRVADELARWATLSEPELHEALFALTGEEPDFDLQSKARRLFAKVLDAPGGMRIETIHAFCQSLLRRFPVEAGLAPGFELIEEQDAEDLRRDARRTLLASTEPAIQQAVAAVAARTSEDEFEAVMAALVAERGRLAALVHAAGGVEALSFRIRAALGIGATESEADAIAAFCAHGGCDAEGLKAALAALRIGGAKGDLDKIDRIAAFLAAAPDARGTLLAAYRRAFLTQSGERLAAALTKKAAAADPRAEAVLIAEAERWLAHEERLRAIRTAEATRALLLLGEAFATRYERMKARMGVLDYDDLIAATARLLTDPGQAWVLYKLDGGIDHVLVDEAQDTNPEQWSVILALIEEFSSGETARGDKRTVFVVGDEKQSIFSFQRADPAEFARARARIGARHEAAGRAFETIPLDTSFRSVSAVLAAVDGIFARPEARDGVTAEPTVHHVSPRRARDGGLVELWPLLKVPEDAPEPAWEPPTEQRGPTSAAARLAERVAETVRGWIDQGTILPSQGRPIRADDVMILVRTRNRFFLEIARCLKKLGVPVAGTDRTILTDQLAVMDLLALGRFLLLPEDDLSLAETLKGPLVGFDDDRLFAIAHDRPGSLWSALASAARSDPSSEAARLWLAGLLARADQVPPFELFAGLLAGPCPADPVSGRRAIARRLGPEAEEPLDAFLDQTLAFGRRLPPSLQRFLDWIEAGGVEVKRLQEPRGGAVRIMTVHGSKGLQAPIVIMPDMTGKPQPPVRGGDRILWPDGTLTVPLWAPRSEDACAAYLAARDRRAERLAAEYRRLLYVALTRAQDRLYLCGHLGKRERTPDCWHALCEAGLRDVPGVEAAAIAGFDEPGLRLETPQRREPGAEAPAEAAPRHELPAWLGAAAPPEPLPFRPLTPSRPAEPDPPARSPLEADDGARFRRGALIHTLLQHLPGLPPAGRPAAAAAWMARQDMTAAERDEIVATTLAVLDAPGHAGLFGPGSRAEVPVTGIVGDRVLAGQIDRLLVTPDAVTILDFKTNRPPPVTEAAVGTAYLAQMAAYRAALRAIYPDRPVRCALLWTEGPRLMPLSDELLDRHAPGMMAKS